MPIIDVQYSENLFKLNMNKSVMMDWDIRERWQIQILQCIQWDTIQFNYLQITVTMDWAIELNNDYRFYSTYTCCGILLSFTFFKSQSFWSEILSLITITDLTVHTVRSYLVRLFTNHSYSGLIY